jgi:hypothetical protein
MFAKVFEQIFDSSISEDWQVRLVFEDFLVLADVNGVVDKMPEAISRRTNVPLDIVKRAISVLESPDPRSRRQNDDGRRIVRLDEHRDWGWMIVNYAYYRSIASEEQRRETTKLRVKKYRQGEADVDAEGKALRNSTPALHLGIEEDFDKFWAIYPRKDAKKDAEKAWEQTTRNRPGIDALIPILIRKISENEWTKDRMTFIPLPATWLRGHRWEDADKTPQEPPHSNRTPVQPLLDPELGKISTNPDGTVRMKRSGEE